MYLRFEYFHAMLHGTAVSRGDGFIIFVVLAPNSDVEATRPRQLKYH